MFAWRNNKHDPCYEQKHQDTSKNMKKPIDILSVMGAAGLASVRAQTINVKSLMIPSIAMECHHVKVLPFHCGHDGCRSGCYRRILEWSNFDL